MQMISKSYSRGVVLVSVVVFAGLFLQTCRVDDEFEENLSAHLGVHYSYKSRNPFAIGLSGDYSWRFLQLYLLSDNLISWFLPKAVVPISLFDPKSEVRVIIPKAVRSINFRFGLNIVLRTT